MKLELEITMEGAPWQRGVSYDVPRDLLAFTRETTQFSHWQHEGIWGLIEYLNVGETSRTQADVVELRAVSVPGRGCCLHT